MTESCAEPRPTTEKLWIQELRPCSFGRQRDLELHLARALVLLLAALCAGYLVRPALKVYLPCELSELAAGEALERRRSPPRSPRRTSLDRGHCKSPAQKAFPKV